jgi:hypothetical protein
MNQQSPSLLNITEEGQRKKVVVEKKKVAGRTLHEAAKLLSTRRCWGVLKTLKIIDHVTERPLDPLGYCYHWLRKQMCPGCS